LASQPGRPAARIDGQGRRAINEGLPRVKNWTAARIAGLMYVLTTLLGLANTFVFKPGVKDLDTFLETGSRYRLTLSADLLMFLLVIVMSWALYLVTRPINRGAALLALLFRFGEGLLGCVVICIGTMALVTLRAEGWDGFGAAQLGSLASISWGVNGAIWNVLFILMGIGAMIFVHLLNIAKAIPRWLGAWGLFTYVSMTAYGFAKLLLPDLPRELMGVMLPGAAFEFVFGVWLMAKGVSLPPLAAPRPARA
jgi:hypothetical protein